MSSLTDALSFVERLRNVEDVHCFGVFSLTEVPLSFTTVFRAQVPGKQAPVDGDSQAASDDSSILGRGPDGGAEPAPGDEVELPVPGLAPFPVDALLPVELADPGEAGRSVGVSLGFFAS